MALLRTIIAVLAVTVWASTCRAETAKAIDFGTDIQPLIEAACLRCHHAQEADGELRLDSRGAAIKGGDRASRPPGPGAWREAPRGARASGHRAWCMIYRT